MGFGQDMLGAEDDFHIFELFGKVEQEFQRAGKGNGPKRGKTCEHVLPVLLDMRVQSGLKDSQGRRLS